MSTIYSMYDNFLSVHCNVVKRQDELSYDVLYISFIDEHEHAEVTDGNNGNANM